MTNTTRPSKIMSLCKRIARHLRNDSGNAAMLFGLSSIPVLMAAGMGIDMVRANFEQTSFHAAVDSAALAIAADTKSSTMGLNATQIATREGELAAIAQAYVNKHYQQQSLNGVVSGLKVKLTGQEIKVSAKLTIDTIIMGTLPEIQGFNGVDDFTFNFESVIKKAVRPIELAVVIDVTGSMNQSASGSGGQSKLDGAKQALAEFFNDLYAGTGGTSEFMRLALVPFSGAVRLDKNAHDFDLSWIDTTGSNPLSKLNFNNSTTTPPSDWNNYTAWSKIKKSSSAYHSWNGCVEVRGNDSGTDHRVLDTPPASGSSKFPAYFSPDTTRYKPSTSSSSTTETGTTYFAAGTLTAVGSECRGITTANCTIDTSTTKHAIRQENYLKYVDANIGAESVNTQGPWTNCAPTAIMPLTHNGGAIQTAVANLTAQGPTVIPEGLAWGWRVLSPTEPFTKVQGGGGAPNGNISPYGDPKWQKVMVLITDGDNDVGPGGTLVNGSAYTSYGFQTEPNTGANNRFGTTSTSAIETSLDTRMSAICTNVKATGIKLYVAAYGSGISSATKTLLKNCSSNTSTDTAYYSEATTPQNLNAFLDHVGEDVINKAIYVAK